MRIGTLLVPALAAAMSLACSRERRERFLIPDGYAGWLCVTYGRTEAAPLPTEEGFRLVVFPPSGVVLTSSPARPGEGYTDEFVYYGDGRRRQLNVGKEMGGGYTEEVQGTEGFTFKFWVSRDAKADYEGYVKGHDQHCGPFPNYGSVGAS
jgi:hypothetical protein